MNIYESSDEWLGFVQDFSRRINEISKPDRFTEFDPVTRLLSYPSFSNKIKKIMPKVKRCCLATLYVNGLDKLGSYLTVDNANNCLTSVAETIKSFLPTI